MPRAASRPQGAGFKHAAYRSLVRSQRSGLAFLQKLEENTGAAVACAVAFIGIFLYLTSSLLGQNLLDFFNLFLEDKVLVDFLKAALELCGLPTLASSFDLFVSDGVVLQIELVFLFILVTFFIAVMFLENWKSRVLGLIKNGKVRVRVPPGSLSCVLVS